MALIIERVSHCLPPGCAFLLHHPDCSVLTPVNPLIRLGNHFYIEVAVSEVHVRACMLTCFSRVRLFATPWIVARQAPLSMGFLQARRLEWVVIPFSRGSS